MSFCRLDFWDRVDDDYQVDMTPLKDYARECVTRRPYEMTVRPKDVLAGAVKIQHFNIETMETEDLKLVKVWNFYQLKGIFSYLYKSKQDELFSFENSHHCYQLADRRHHPMRCFDYCE